MTIFSSGNVLFYFFLRSENMAPRTFSDGMAAPGGHFTTFDFVNVKDNLDYIILASVVREV